MTRNKPLAELRPGDRIWISDPWGSKLRATITMNTPERVKIAYTIWVFIFKVSRNNHYNDSDFEHYKSLNYDQAA